MSRFERYVDWAATILGWIAAFLILVMMLGISYSVIVRFIFNSPVTSVIEFTSYLMLFITFLGTAWLHLQRGHVRVDLIVNLLPQRVRDWVDFATSFLALGICVLLVWKGAEVTIDAYRRSLTMIGVMEIPQWVLIIVIPIGAFVLLLSVLVNMYRLATHRVESGKVQETC